MYLVCIDSYKYYHRYTTLMKSTTTIGANTKSKNSNGTQRLCYIRHGKRTTIKDRATPDDIRRAIKGARSLVIVYDHCRRSIEFDYIGVSVIGQPGTWHGYKITLYHDE